MKTGEAAELLSAGLGDGDSKRFADLAAQLSDWPLLIKLVNRYLFDRVETGQPVAKAIEFVSGKLKRQGLTAFDAEDADQRNDAGCENRRSKSRSPESEHASIAAF